MKKNQLIIVVIIMVAAIALAAGLRALDPKLEHKAASRLVPLVEYTTVSPGSVSFSIESHGTVTPRQAGPVSSEVSGRILTVAPGFRIGNFVKQGDVLLTIDPTEYELAVANAKTVLYDRQLQLEDRKSRYASDSLTLKQAEAAYQAAVAALQKAERDLAKTGIAAPYNGVVTQKYAEVGQFVNRGGAVAELSGSDIAEVRLPVNPADILLVAPDLYTGKKPDITVTLTRELGREPASRTLQNVRIEGSVDRQARTFLVSGEIRNPYGNPAFPAGIFVTASIGARPVAAAVELPQHAIHNGNSVYLLAGNKVKLQPVEILYRQGNSAIITAGLKEGDQVVVSRPDLIFDGMEVQAKAATAAQQLPGAPTP